MACILGRKIGMTQSFGPDGEIIPITVVQAGPCRVLTQRAADKNGYQAAILGFEEVEGAKIRNKAKLGAFKKLQTSAYRVVREFRDFAPTEAEISVGAFAPGDVLQVCGISKGKGFQNVIKLWNFKTGRESHGGNCQRKIGSTGMHTWPARVIPGKKMPGNMGNERVTLKSVEVVGILPEENVLLLKGPLPGRKDTLLAIRKTGTKKQKVAS